jgi:AcrR family transcriptional regulator
VAAPSIYAHFPDAAAIVQAVVDQTLDALVAHLDRARADADGPRARLVACCRGYVAFGAEQPALYALLFGRPRAAPRPRGPEAAAVDRGRAFEILLQDVTDTIADGSARAGDALVTATELWAAMHGLVLLRAAAPRFPWPDPERIETELVERIALA